MLIIEEIFYEEEIPVYDLTVPETSSFFANNILVHNCSEIFLFQDQDHSYTCVLASMNLFMYDQWKDTSAIFDATVFLDCVAEDFIQNAKGKAGFEKSVRFTEKGRALGLGVCGYHSYLQDHMMAFESLDALFFNQMFFKELHDKSLDASQWMAKEFGEPEWCKGYGVRNTHRTAIAPTMSTSQIMGGISQGIEPMQGCCFVQTSSGGEEERINPIFLKLMKSRGKNNKKIQKDIMDNYGSCQHLDWVTDEEKLVFRTAPEIDQTVIIRQASQRQRWICQGQSLNLFVYSSTPAKHIAYLHKLIIKDEWIKGAYYLRGQAGVSASLGCVACQ